MVQASSTVVRAQRESGSRHQARPSPAAMASQPGTCQGMPSMGAGCDLRPMISAMAAVSSHRLARRATGTGATAVERSR